MPPANTMAARPIPLAPPATGWTTGREREPAGASERPGAFLERCREAAADAQPVLSSGHLTRINGLVMEASGLKLPLGSSCRIIPGSGARSKPKWSVLPVKTLPDAVRRRLWPVTGRARHRPRTAQPVAEDRQIAPVPSSHHRSRQADAGGRITSRPRGRCRRTAAGQPWPAAQRDTLRRCKAARSTRCHGHRSRRHSTSACARSMRC